ncbi:MAG: plastocyanin/azurin family copper-binding protein [Patescibacteria group bacterium]
MKRIFSVFLLLSLVFGALPVFAYGAAPLPHGEVVKKVVMKKVIKKEVKKVMKGKKSKKSSLKHDGAMGEKQPPAPSVPPATVPPASPAVTAPASLKVSIQNFAFSPSVLNVKVGDTVTWTNLDSATHTVEADGGSFKSGSLTIATAPFSFTFTTPGTFAYHCGPHPSMTASVVVTQ